MIEQQRSSPIQGADDAAVPLAENPRLRVYQPFLDSGQRAALNDKAIAFDISFNRASQAREYELFKVLHQQQSGPGMLPGDFWGLVSSKFEVKSPIPFDSFLEKAEAARIAGCDAYLINPMIGNAAIYANVMEHAQAGGHQSMSGLFPFLQSLGCPVQDLQGSAQFFFCNYIVGNELFWTSYFTFCDGILGRLEDEAVRGSEAGRIYAGGGQYFRDATASMRPFVIERLLGYFVKVAGSAGLKIEAYRPQAVDFEWKFGPRLGPLLHALYETKEALVTQDDRAAGQVWMEARLPILREPQLVWQLDDPPVWMGVRAKAPVPVGPSAVEPTAAATQPVAIEQKPATATSGVTLKPFAKGWDFHRDRHCIWIVTPPGYTHSHAFDEVALALSGAFSDLGGSAPIVRDPSAFAGRAPIIYGANNLDAGNLDPLPSDSVIINLEQVSEESEWFDDKYLALLNGFPVLDYSPRNRANLVRRGISHAGLMEIGYHPKLQRIRPAAEQDFDILFYGALCDRRKAILGQLHERGLKVANLFSIYGRERDAAIARSKLVINMHYYESAVFEIVRVSYLLANGVCVLTEGRPDEPDIAPFAGGLAVEPYERLVERAIALAADGKERSALGASGLHIMRGRSQTQMLKMAMGM
jgi:hypothetical protein